MYGNPLGLWFTLNPQHFVHLCGVKRLTKPQRVPNSCWETNGRDKHIGQLAAPSQRWRGCHQSQFNIKQTDLKVYDKIQTKSNNQVTQHLSRSSPKFDCAKMLKVWNDHEAQWRTRNDHEWPRMATKPRMTINGHKWPIPCASHLPYHPLPSHTSP